MEKQLRSKLQAAQDTVATLRNPLAESQAQRKVLIQGGVDHPGVETLKNQLAETTSMKLKLAQLLVAIARKGGLDALGPKGKEVAQKVVASLSEWFE